LTHSPPHDESSSSQSAELGREELDLALQARERLLDGILDSLETFFSVDEEWRVTFANKAAAGMARMPAEQLVGRVLWEVMPDAEHETTEELLRRAMSERVSVEYEAPGPEGTTYLGTAYPLDDGGLAVYARDVTDVKRGEAERAELFAALERSEQSFEAVFEASPFAMSLTEMPSVTLLRVNGAFEELFGYSRDDLLGRTSPELGISDPESQEEVSRRFAADGVLRDYEVPRTTHDGQLKTLSINLDWVTIGQQRAILTTIRDVTRRAAAQEDLRASQDALRVSEQRYRSIVETTGDGIMVGAPDGTIEFVNQRMADMLGYDREEMVGLHGFDLIDTAWRSAVLENRATLGGGEVLRGEFKLRRKDGSAIWTVFSSTPVFDAEGRHTSNLTMHSDISELKAAEEALRLSDERFRMVLGAAQVSVAAQDRDLRFVWAFNQRTSPSSGVVGKTDADVFSPPEAERLQAIKRRVLDAGVEVREQMWLDRPGGHIFLDCTFTPLLDEAGEVTGVGITTVDLTPMRLAEEARRQSEETLRSFYDSAPLMMGVSRLDEHGIVIVSANRTLGDYLGMGASEIAGRTGAELGTPPQFERMLVDAFRESQRAAHPVRFEQTVHRPGEDEKAMAFTVAHIGAGHDGGPLFSFVIEDITERRRSEEALRTSEIAAAGQEERSRLARDLHDSVTQALFAASLKAEALTTAGDAPPETVRMVEDVRRLTSGALAQMRTMLLELRGESLDGIPLRQLLRNVVEATESRTQTEVELTVEGDEAVAAELHIALYRIAQEALNNVARHARAQHAWVELSLAPDLVRLSVKDDGDGFDLQPLGPAHLGVRSMRERAAEAGADLRLDSIPGRGTEVVVEWRPAPS
jgi:PAS domain S-box-containing protein